MKNNFLNIVNKLLDLLKNTLVRFKKAGFGIFFMKNLFTLPDLFTDREYNPISKLKIIATFLITISYFASSIDFMPEALFGGLGFLDDVLILIWSIGLINEQILNYQKAFENSPKSKIIEDVNWKMEDE